MFVMRHFMSDATKWRLFIAQGAREPGVPAARRPHQRLDSHRRRRDRSRRTDHGHRGPLNEEHPMRTRNAHHQRLCRQARRTLAIPTCWSSGWVPSAPPRQPARALRCHGARGRPGHGNLHEAPRHRARQRGLAHPADWSAFARASSRPSHPAGAVPLAAVRPLCAHRHAKVIDGHPVLVTFYQPELEQLLRAKLAGHPTARHASRASRWKACRRRHARHGAAEGSPRASAARRVRASWSAPTARTRSCGALLGLDFEGRPSRRTG